ncbi:hypothetical protein ACJMK2_004317 [Sinanodonta woodiana]|uniref:Uncharacterized protein n=1 Tax=Sinanodonta woodiana TaxID=1069815 RepID=A0ABD3Y2G3_SINWO
MSTSSQAETQLSQALQCPICLETFTRPKVLPCGHTYCASCLQSHINNKVTQSELAQACFPCPVCRADTLLSDPNICIEQWAESLPVNSIVSSLMDVSARKQEVYHCDQCIKQGKESLGTYLCKDCVRSMCMSCKQYHDVFPSLGQHEVISVSDGGESCFVTPNLSKLDACNKHSKKRIKFICCDHETPCCNTCVILEHRKCERVITVDDMLKSFDVNKKSSEIKTNLAIFENHLKQITCKIKFIFDNIQTDKAGILQQIHSLKAQLIAKLQNLDDVIAALESNYESESLNLQTQDIDGQTLIAAIVNDRTQLDLVLNQGSEIQKFIMLHNLDQNQPRYLRAITEYQKDIKDVRIHLDVDETLPTYVNNISELGKMNILRNYLDFGLPCLEAVKTKVQPVSIIEPTTGPLKDRKAVKVSEFKVKELSDINVCHITEIVHLRDARVIMVDFQNYKIKLFGQDHKYKESMQIQERPWSACMLTDTEIAVTVPAQKEIQIIEIKDKMLKKREITTKCQCWAIGTVHDHLVITTGRHSVIILDMHGNEIKTVWTDTSHSQRQLKTNFIKVDSTKPALYISHETANKLVAYSLTWDSLFTYKNPDLKTPAGIAIDREGNIYLCGYNSHCVQQISSEGKIIKTLLSKIEENKKPLSIALYGDTDKFILGYGKCDVVEVYELQCS